MALFELTAEILLRAYMMGFFPMAEAHDNPKIHWLDPSKRGILFFENFYIPKRLRKTLRNYKGRVVFDHDFSAIIAACAQRTDRRKETWLNQDIINIYEEIFEKGYGHSVEVYDENNRLAGGLYGVHLGTAFFGESMFSSARDTSKIALVHLIVRLAFSGFLFLDTQFLTPHLKQFGVVEVPKLVYHRHLRQAMQEKTDFFKDYTPEEVFHFLKK